MLKRTMIPFYSKLASRLDRDGMSQIATAQTEIRRAAHDARFTDGRPHAYSRDPMTGARIARKLFAGFGNVGAMMIQYPARHQ